MLATLNTLGVGMGLLRITRTPLVTVSAQATVMDAVRTMHEEHIGAIAVVDNGRLTGIFSERDLMNRVVLQRRDPGNTSVGDVMTSPVITIERTSTADDALKLMDEKHIRHLPVVNIDGKLAGMLSVRSLLHEKVEELTDQLDSLEAYFTADGAGG
ncbi:MAG: histidine kinase [Acidobacteria bacterium]|nr:MAG: histidine kinase [Acidobacteriota bacterium]